MDDTLKQRMRDHLKANEGEKPQPYRDSNDNLTVGVGINVNRKADFVAQKFQTKDAQTGELRDATPQEKADEFNRLSKMSEPDIKRDPKRFTLPETEINAKLDEKIAEHEAGVKSQIGEADWNKLTDGQKTAVLDRPLRQSGRSGQLPQAERGDQERRCPGNGKPVGFPWRPDRGHRAPAPQFRPPAPQQGGDAGFGSGKRRSLSPGGRFLSRPPQAAAPIQGTP